MKKLCDACGAITPSGISMGGAYICRDCDPDIHEEIDRLREEGKPVNVRHIAKRLFREQHGSGTWLMKDPPVELWQRAKGKAAEQGITLRELVVLALDGYLKK